MVLPLSVNHSDNGIRVIGHVEETKNIQLANSDLPVFDEPSIQFHYRRIDHDYDPWGLWIWADSKEGAEYTFNYRGEDEGIAYYPLSTFGNAMNLGFIVKKLFSVVGTGVWKKDFDYDSFVDLDMITPDDHDVYHVYLKGGSGIPYTNEERTQTVLAVEKTQFEDSKTILVKANNPIKRVEVTRNGVSEPVTSSYSEDGKTCTLTLGSKAQINDVFRANIVFEVEGAEKSCEKGISIRKLYDEEFDEEYNYDGELGAIYTPSKTEFKVWSPVSKSIVLRIYDNGTPTSVNASKGSDVYRSYAMERDSKGVFSTIVNEDLEGKYYTYFVTNSSYPEGKEVVDPYAKSAGVNGLRGMIVDFSKTNPEGWDQVNYLNYDRKALTVYETHIAELTCSETWGGTPSNAKLYKGFYETGTTYTNNGVTVKTGFDHIKELGVNAVQIIPFFDQANDETNMTFNWGYNPLNYNVLEGGYSSDPYDGYARIKEFKELVKAYNNAGISIIMDVVYNHVNGLSGSNFDVLMPYYYYRYDDGNGSPSNGSGCGNETASDKYMFRKFMIDSTSFWTTEYKMGGFRFDLMAIHDVASMNELVAKNKEINPYTVIYGEPWAAGNTAMPKGLTPASQANLSKFEGYGAFNDKLRDSLISGGLSPSYSKEWVTQTKYVVASDVVVQGLKGITKGASTDPNKAVSYVTCHDNYTLHDRAVTADISNSDIEVEDYKDEATIEKMNALAYSIVFTSQGTSFMLAGEEMLRTKINYDDEGNVVNAVNARGEVLNIPSVNENSYNACYKTNEINYQWKIDHLNLFKTYQKLIALKKTAVGLHATDPNEIELLADGKVIKMSFVGEENKEYVVYHRNGVGMDDMKNEDVSVISIIASSLTACSSEPNPFVVATDGYNI